MAIVPAANSSFDAARTSSVASPSVFGMSGDDPMVQPYRQEETMSFGDFLDIINPLQHIPLVSTLYREITGDTINQSSRVMGGFLYGGPLGGMGAVVNVMVEDATGKDIGGQLLSAVSGGNGAETAQRLSSQPIALTPQGAAQQAAQRQAAQQPPLQQAIVAQAPAAAPSPATASGAPAAGAASSPAGNAQSVPNHGAPVQGASSPAAPAHGAGGATSALMTARNQPPAPINPERAQELQQQLLNGQYHPSRMPSRDTTPASTVQAKHAATLAARQWSAHDGAVPASVAAAANAPPAANAARRPPPAPAYPSVPSQSQSQSQPQPAAAAVPSTTAGAAGDQPAAAGPTPVPPAMLSDVMMRNLAKYEAAKKALNPTPPVIRTAQ